jgi:hypothetical protein
MQMKFNFFKENDSEHGATMIIELEVGQIVDDWG